MIRRVRDQSGNHHCLHLKLGDLPALNLGDERFIIGLSGAAVGLATGAIITSIVARGRMINLRKHLIATRNEVESTRKISQNDVLLAKQFGTTNVFKDLLPTCDNIDRALASHPSSSSDNNRDSSSDWDRDSALRSGIELTRNELLKVLLKHGVAPIAVTPGDVFSPDLCEAMLAQPLPPLTSTPTPATTLASTSTEAVSGTETGTGTVAVAVAGTISGVFLPGYTMHDRVIRPAQVGVYRDRDEEK